jgi:hypothetical protein
VDRDEPVRTTVILKQQGGPEIESIETDAEGNYSFLVEEPGEYTINVSVMDLLDTCDELRTASGVWLAAQVLDTSGVVDVRASSMPMSIEIGDKLTVNCELNCD